MSSTPERWSALEQLEPRQLFAAISWDGGGHDNLWTNPLNWSGDILPTLSDDVAIDTAQSPVRIQQGDAAFAYFLSSSVPLDISGGQLNVAGLWTHHAALNMSGGAVSAGIFSLDGDMMWIGGNITAGRGYTTIGHRLTIDGDVSLNSMFENDGTLEWRSGNLQVQGPGAPSVFLNRFGATFLIKSSGTLSSSTGMHLINTGTLILDAAPGTTTTLAITFTNDTGSGPVTNPWIGTVDVRSGTLAFTGDLPQKQGNMLAGGNWYVSSSAARLLLPGPDIDIASGTFILNGAGSSFPALEHASSIANLTLSGGRQWSFPNYDANLYGFTNLIIDNPGMTTVIPASSSPASLGSVRTDNLVLRGGRLDIVGGLIGHRVEVQAGTVLVLGGISRLPYADVSGAGLIRVKGELDWPSGTIAGPGQLVITETGHFTTTGQYFELFDKTLTRRVINRGVMDLSEFSYNIQFSGEIANRGVLNLYIEGYLSTSAGIGPGYAPGFITNFGTINSYSNLTVRGASGAIRLNNQGTVHVASGTLILNGGAYGGGNWVVDAGAEIAFGGFGSQLLYPTFSGAGRIRDASPTGWTNAHITGTGDFLITAPGSLALLGPNTTITRGTFTNNGKLYLGNQSHSTITGNIVNNAFIHTGTGTLNVAGDMTFTPGSSLFVVSAFPAELPRINVTGQAAADGAITMLYTWPASFGAQYRFLSTGGHTGQFSYVNAYGNAQNSIPMFFWDGQYGTFALGIF